MLSLVAAFLSLSPVAAEPPLPPVSLPEGHRAYAVKVDQTDSAPFIQPGQRVDVVESVKDKGKVKARVVVNDVLVVAVDTLVKDKRTTIITATLAVKKDDANKLAAAEKNGKLQILLRRPADK